MTDKFTGGRGGIRTRDLRLRRPTLYPAELPAHIALHFFLCKQTSNSLLNYFADSRIIFFQKEQPANL